MVAKSGPHFLISADSSQNYDVSLAGLTNGLFVAVYDSKVDSGASATILQILNADGSKRGADTFALFGGSDPAVAAAPDASFYYAPAPTGPTVNTFGHTDIDGNKLPNRQLFFSTGEVDLAVRADGGRVGVSEFGTGNPNDPDIGFSFFHADHFNAGNSPLIVNSNVSGAQTRPEVAALTSGRFVTVWESGINVLFRLTDVTYGPDPNFHDPGEPDVAIITHLGNQTPMAVGSRPTVAALPGNRFVVLWYEKTGGIGTDRILGRILDGNGNVSGAGAGDFVAATNVQRDSGSNFDIAVTVLPNGTFVVAWTGVEGTSLNGSDNSGTYVDAAIFSSTATPGTSAFTLVTSLAAQVGALTTLTAGDQFDPSLTTLADGRFVLGWTDGIGPLGFVTGLNLRGQIFDTRTAAINITGTPGHDDYVGTAFADTFNGGAGDDTITGGPGADTARFAGPRSAYTIQDLGDGRIQVSGPDGTDTLRSIATLIFDDATVPGNINLGPDLTGGASITRTTVENKLAAGTITATDPDLDPLTFSIIGGADQAKFTINPSTGALRFITAPDFEAPTDSNGDNGYVVQIQVSDGLLTDTQFVAVNVTNSLREVATPLDFNGEGTSDILLRRTDGLFSLLLIDNLGVQSAPSVGQVGNEWRTARIGNFDNDRDADLLVRRDDGALHLFGFEAGQVKSSVIVGQVGNEWKAAGVGDFDADGDRDLLIRRDDGALNLFGFEAGQVKSSVIVGQVGNEWRSVGVGDFDGDGDGDLLMRRDDATLYLFEFEAGQVTSGAILAGQVGNEWQAAGIGDFDGDDDSDLLLRRDDGTLLLFGFEAGEVKSSVLIGQVGNEWHSASVGNYDGDSDFDWLLQRDDGTLLICEFEAGQLRSTVVIGAVGSEWSII